MNKPAPEHLAAAGREVWVQMQAAYLLDPNEERLLLEACRTADELERLQAALRKAKTLAAGSMGQAKANPLFAELRLHRAALASLIKTLESTQRRHAASDAISESKAYADRVNRAFRNRGRTGAQIKEEIDSEL